MSLDIVNYQIAGNELWRLAIVFSIVLASFIVSRIIRYMMEAPATRDEKKDEEVSLPHLLFRSASRPGSLMVMVGGLRLASLWLQMSEQVQSAAETLLQWLFSGTIAYFMYRLVDVVDYYLKSYAARTEHKLDDMVVPFVSKAARVVIVILIGLYMAESLSGRPIGTIVAGLGLGGLAFALAAQDTIKNLFGSLMILTDRPFSVGERVVVDGHDGPVEEVGLRSTKIRTLTGHVVTVPNEKMASNNVENISRRPYIRRLFNVTITYDTPPDKVERAINIIREILDNHEGMRPEFPPRVFFNDFNDWSLNILVIYWYHPPSYWDFLNFAEQVNIKIMRAFEREGIEFAFPTQTLYLANDDRRQLALNLLNRDLLKEEQ